jgi:hypothetical protein
MNLNPVELVQSPGGLVHLLSTSEGSLFWAAGMRQEIRNCLQEQHPDHEYLSHCLSLLLRSGGWRLLKDGAGDPFFSFPGFCCAAWPHGLGMSPGQLAFLLTD